MADFSEKLKELCVVYNAQQDAVRQPFTVLAEKLKLPPDSPVWNQIILALANRKRLYPNAMAATERLATVSIVIRNDLTEGFVDLQKKFIAMFAAQDFAPASYHFYGHGVEMSKDPGNFLRPVLAGNSLAEVLQQLTNALGAAHDIIQNAGPYVNEARSAEIFVAEAKKMINRLLANPNAYKPEDAEALQQFRDQALPVYAEECIVNSTYMVFGAGKRDFDNILTQIDKVFSPAQATPESFPRLTTTVAGMKLSMALSDTRRAAMTNVVNKLEMIKNIPPQKHHALETLLQTLNPPLLAKGEKLPALNDETQQNKLMRIEAFLLRLGQNVRMTSELAVHFKKDPSRKELINDIRANNDVRIDLNAHFTPFLESIKGDFGEVAFARDLSAIDKSNIGKSELDLHVEYYGLQSMVNPQTFDKNGWGDYASQLTSLYDKVTAPGFDQAQKQEIADITYFTAAKSPGHKVGQEIYDAMLAYRRVLTYIPTTKEQRNTLDANIREVENADAGLSVSLTKPRSLTHFDSSGVRNRLYSNPNITPVSPSPPQSPSPTSGNGKLPPLGFEIKPDRARAATVAQPSEKQSPTLPPINTKPGSR